MATNPKFYSDKSIHGDKFHSEDFFDSDNF